MASVIRWRLDWPPRRGQRALLLVRLRARAYVGYSRLLTSVVHCSRKRCTGLISTASSPSQGMRGWHSIREQNGLRLGLTGTVARASNSGTLVVRRGFPRLARHGQLRRCSATHTAAHNNGTRHQAALGRMVCPTHLTAALSSSVTILISTVLDRAHAGFVTEGGDAFIYGRTHSFRDVIRSTNIQRLAPRLVSFLNHFTLTRGVDTLVPGQLELPGEEKVKKIVCSAALTLVLTESGKLFTLGANGYGQCGIGKESVSVEEPALLEFDGDEVVDIAAGFQHGLAVTKSGTVFSWGKGERGQLGYGTANVSAPQEILALKGKRAVQVSAGFNHSSCVTGTTRA